ncbi:hypothetical protein AK88_05604 [Plasmodium fragile]|uniref:Uncharacterized protein n=1 Tax=Plasmodium fragile TaxID=5857 RepID=A0A0D9QCR0_PLAFR|nr:uncharacterized protein AK88_05604 [Plasmodium fragile]KJP84764.1 hypothetical protein AK88_05604 [Plasmodium fragile]
MAHLNTISTSIIPQGASQCRNGKPYSAGNADGETHGTRAHGSLCSNIGAMLFLVACIFLKHPDDFETQEQHVAKVHNRVSRSLAKIKAIASDHDLVLDPMAFEHYDGAYDDVDEPYEEAYQFPPKRIYSDAQWEEEEDGTILKAWKMVEYQVPQQVHYYGKWKITHDEREEEVDSSDTLSADVAVSASAEKSSTSLSKVGAQASLPPSLQNKGQSAKTKQEPKGSSGTGKTHVQTGRGEKIKIFRENCMCLFFRPKDKRHVVDKLFMKSYSTRLIYRNNREHKAWQAE